MPRERSVFCPGLFRERGALLCDQALTYRERTLKLAARFFGNNLKYPLSRFGGEKHNQMLIVVNEIVVNCFVFSHNSVPSSPIYMKLAGNHSYQPPRPL